MNYTTITEPILSKKSGRIVLFPIQYDDIWQFYKKAEASFWTAEEIDLHQDITDWDTKLTADEKKYVKHILIFLTVNGGNVNKNFAENMIGQVQYKEAKFFYGFQTMMGNIHSETYSLLINTYIKDQKGKDDLFTIVETLECVKTKTDWVARWIDEGSFAENLIAFAAVKGIFCSSSFCSIFWLKKRGLMPGLTFSNELISRDERMHSDFASLLYNNHIQNKLSNETVHKIITASVEGEKVFVSDSIPVGLIGISTEFMCQYIEFCGDRLLVTLGNEKAYNSVNPFPWMDKIALQGKNNLFVKNTIDYSGSNVIANLSKQVFSLSE